MGIERERAVVAGGKRRLGDEKGGDGRGGCDELFYHAQSIPKRRAKIVHEWPFDCALQAG